MNSEMSIPPDDGEISGTLSRRSFLKSAGVAGLSAAAAGTLFRCVSSKRILGANDTVRIGVAGLRSKGAQHVEIFQSLDHVQIAALCDVDRDILAREAGKLKASGTEAAVYSDFRKMLENKDLDAVIVASPNHWHSLMGVWACQAGKDVYVEKPVSHSVWEGRQLVKAARQYKRIVQAGTQKRSDEGLIEAFDYIRQGHLGKILLARGLCYKERNSIGKVRGPQPISKQINYDLWTGPAALEPLMRENLHYDWHWFWNTGNGDLGNQGIHEVDLCRWVIGESGLCNNVSSYGGRYGYIDDGETPNTQIVFYDYQPVPILFEVRGLPRSPGIRAMDHFKGIRIGVIVHCENGYFAGGDGGGWVYDPDGKKIKQFTGTGGVKEHASNFIDAVRSRKESDLRGDIEDGHISSALCHLGNISFRTGTLTEPDVVEKILSDSEYSNDAFQRVRRHLENNHIPLNQTLIRTGPRLRIDPSSEQFISDEAMDLGFFANRLLKRDYRKPFVVPENI